MTTPSHNTDFDSQRAWLRLAAAFAISTVGSAGMWIPPVVLPMLQQEFGISRADASLPYTATMIGVGAGTILLGRLSDRFGVFRPLVVCTFLLALGYAAAGTSSSLWQFSLAQGALIAFFGCAMTFAPLVADVSLWFQRYRGVAVAICACGNYSAGMIWPPVVYRLAEEFGWRGAYFWVGAASVAIILPLAFLLRARPPALDAEGQGAGAAAVSARPLGFAPNTLQGLLVIAGLSCCIAMSMPQVHIVAYCSDLGYGVARGAEMLSIMLGLGIISRFASGFIADRIGGLTTLLAGSALQAIVLALFLPFEGLASLYVLSALFGLVQGGIVACYPIIVREFFPAREAGLRIGIALTATLFGMAAGGWLTGAIFDLSGSYRAAFVHGLAWNLLNLGIVVWLLMRSRRLPRVALAVQRAA